jgi:hypothetical protein
VAELIEFEFFYVSESAAWQKMVTGNEVSAPPGFGGFPEWFHARKFEACHHIYRIDHFCHRLLEVKLNGQLQQAG